MGCRTACVIVPEGALPEWDMPLRSTGDLDTPYGRRSGGAGRDNATLPEPASSHANCLKTRTPFLRAAVPEGGSVGCVDDRCIVIDDQRCDAAHRVLPDMQLRLASA